MNQQVDKMLNWILRWHQTIWIAQLELLPSQKEIRAFGIEWSGAKSRTWEEPVSIIFPQSLHPDFRELEERLREYCVFSRVCVRRRGAYRPRLAVHYWFREAMPSRDLLNPARRRLLAN